MENSGDRFAPFLIPNCQRTASQEAKLQFRPFGFDPKPSSDYIQSSSSTDEAAEEQATGIEMLTLPDSFDEYQTPPEHASYSQNSSNDGHADVDVATTKASDRNTERVVNLAMDSDNLDTEQVDLDLDLDDRFNEIDAAIETVDLDLDDRLNEIEAAIETEVISSPEDNDNDNAHQVFVEMPQREEQISNGEKREFPVSILNRVLKMAIEAKSRDGGGGEDDDNDGDDFLEIAKKRGLSLPRPRWWPVAGFKP